MVTIAEQTNCENQSFTIVSGASSNHFRCLKNLLFTLSIFEPGTRTIIYDLGLSLEEKRELEGQNCELREFPYVDYPPHIKVHPVESGYEQGKRSGCYGWKPIIIKRIMGEFGGSVLWLDAGNLIHCRLDRIRKVLTANGLYSPTCIGSIKEWTHPTTLEYLKVTDDVYDKPNRHAAIIGLSCVRPEIIALVERWEQSALDPSCIGPPGATVKNHRYDQAVFSILVYQLQVRRPRVLVDERLDVSTHHDRLPRRMVKRKLGLK